MLAAVLALAFALVAGACSSSSKSSGSTGSTNPKDFQVTLPSGQASLSLSGELPPGWPSTFPLPPGAKPAGSGSLGGSSSTTRVAVFSTTSTPKDTYDFYANNTALQPSEQSTVGLGAAFVGRMKISGTYTGSLAVVGRDSTTYLVVALEEPSSSTTTSSAA